MATRAKALPYSYSSKTKNYELHEPLARRSQFNELIDR